MLRHRAWSDKHTDKQLVYAKLTPFIPPSSLLFHACAFPSALPHPFCSLGFLPNKQPTHNYFLFIGPTFAKFCVVDTIIQVSLAVSHRQNFYVYILCQFLVSCAVVSYVLFSSLNLRPGPSHLPAYLNRRHSQALRSLLSFEEQFPRLTTDIFQKTINCFGNVLHSAQYAALLFRRLTFSCGSCTTQNQITNARVFNNSILCHFEEE